MSRATSGCRSFCKKIPRPSLFILFTIAWLTIGAGSGNATGSVAYPGLKFGSLEGSGFCANGAHAEIGKLDDDLAPPEARIFGSYCENGGEGTGKISTDTFTASSRLTFYIGGYTSLPGLGLALEDSSSGERLVLTPFPSPNRSWRHYTFSIPSQWRDRPVRLTAWDQSTNSQGWFAFSEPVNLGGAVWVYYLGDALLLFVLTLLEASLLLAPVLAGTIWAVRLRPLGENRHSIVFLLVLGVLGYSLFWLYLISPPIGIGASLALIVGSGIFLWRWRRGPNYRADRNALAPLVTPISICVLVTVGVVQFGFQYGGVDRPQDTPGTRFANQMPGDNNIPKEFADGLFHGHINRPLHGDYLSSDRPPLQTGIFLLERPLVGGTVNLTYQVLGVFLQTTWILGLWCFLSASRVHRQAAVLIVATLLCWGFTLLNEFYTWPKLLPAAYLLALCAYLLSPHYHAVRASAGAGLCAGLLAAFAMLGHGGTAFGLIAIALSALVLGRLPGWRFVVAAIVAFAFAYAPWMAYQKWIDPPGNALIHELLAGKIAVADRSIGQAIHLAYSELPAGTILQYKLANLLKVVGPLTTDLSNTGRLVLSLVTGNLAEATGMAGLLRQTAFFSLGSVLGVLNLGALLGIALLPIHYLKDKARIAERTTAAHTGLCAVAIIAVWVPLMFGPGTTILHQGTYLLPLIAATSCILAAWALSPQVATVLCGVSMLLNLAIYVFLLPYVGTGEVTGTAFNPFSAAIAGSALTGLIWKLYRLWTSNAPLAHSPLA